MVSQDVMVVMLYPRLQCLAFLMNFDESSGSLWFSLFVLFFACSLLFVFNLNNPFRPGNKVHHPA